MTKATLSQAAFGCTEVKALGGVTLKQLETSVTDTAKRCCQSVAARENMPKVTALELESFNHFGDRLALVRRELRRTAKTDPL